MSNKLAPVTNGLPGRVMFIDVYHGDVIKSWSDFRDAGGYGVIHKATQGVGPGAHDPMYAVRRAQFMALPPEPYVRDDGSVVNIPPLWGAYDFNTGDSVVDQVKNFLTIAAPDKDTLLMLDYEDNTHSPMTLAMALEWLERVFDITGQRPVLYSGNRIKTDIHSATDAQRDFLALHRFLLCEYGRIAVLTDYAHHPLPWSRWWAWQRDADKFGPDAHNFPGIATLGVDQDVFDGTPEDLMNTWTKLPA